MSFDRKIDQVCEHYVREEALFLAADRMTVRPLRPIANLRSVSLRVNGTVDVPMVGYHIPALATGANREPFSIDAGVNDRLLVSVNAGPVQTVVANAGSGISARELALDLTSKLSGVCFEVTKKRLLQMKSRTLGRRGRFHILPGSTLAPVLGLPENRVWLGRTPFPSWSLVRDPNTLDDRPTRVVVFDEILNGFQDFVQIDYTTIRQECRRCGGLGVENDWRYTKSGFTIEVRDEALLLQEILKMVFTIQGSNPFHTWYGTGILNAVGRKLSASGAGLLQTLIVSDIQEGFRRWQTVKRQQEELVGQVVSDAEFPFRLLSVSLERSDKDPTIVFVNATVQSRSQQPLQIARGIRIPEPTDLLGATAQQGVYRQSLSKFVQTG